MRRRLILSLSFVAVLSGPGAALAASTPPKEAATGQYLDISPVALPVVYERRLINYVFVSVRVNLANGANALALREKEPFFRDALVRAGHRRPFTRLDDFTMLDEAAIRAVMLPEAKRIAGERAVTGITVTSQQPKQRMGLPKPPQARTGPRPAAPAAHH